MKVDREHLRQRIETLSQSEVMTIAESDGAYTPEAVELAREELASREPEVAGPEEVAESYSTPEYKPLVILSRATQWLIALSVAAHVVETGYALAKSDFTHLSIATPTSVSLSGWFVLIDVATIVCFCCWWYRVARNVRALHATQLKYSPAAAVWAFFIPIVNLFKPVKVAQELWKASDPSIPVNDAASRRAVRNSSLVTAWWTCFVLAGMFNPLRLTIGRVVFELRANIAIAITYALLIAAAIAAIRLIAVMESRQAAALMQEHRHP